MLILDELHQGRKYYRKKISSVNYALDKGILISKYLFSIGMNRHEIESELYKKFNRMYSRIVNEGEIRKKLKYMIDEAEKNPPKTPIISFNQAELDLINSQEEYIKILLMTMMCIYKYSYGEFNATQMDIQRISHLKINSAEFHNLFIRFMEMGFFNSYVVLEKKFEGRRYLGYFKPSDELLSYTQKGSYVVQIDDFRNLWVRIRQILGYEYAYYNCEDCGCIDIKGSAVKKRCAECAYEYEIQNTENWRKKTGWIHPNRKESNSDFYYGWKPKDR